MYYTYVLISQNGKRTYTGHTSNLEKRLQEHNNGEVRSLKKYKPYEILLYENFTVLQQAKSRELFYKTSTGRYQLKKIVHSWKLNRFV